MTTQKLSSYCSIVAFRHHQFCFRALAVNIFRIAMTKVGRFIGAKDQPNKAIALDKQTSEYDSFKEFTKILAFPVTVEFSLCCRTAYPLKQTKLEHLNIHCLLSIISFLNVLDTINLSKTSHLMKAITKLSYIRFSHLSFGDSFVGEDEWSSILRDIGNNLRSIEISKLSVPILDGLVKCCPNVTQIKLIDSSNILDSISFRKYSTFFKNVTDLEIRKSGIYYGKMGRAKRFHNFDALLAILAKSNALTSLKIDYIETGDKTFHHLKSINNLKCLHLNRYVATAPVLPIIPNFLHLKELVLTIEDSKTGEIVSEIKVE